MSAPSNKAVTVIAERFLDVVTRSDLSCKCNAVLIGVEDKLISQSSPRNEESSSATEALSSTLRSIFVYTWVGRFAEDGVHVYFGLPEKDLQC